MRLRRSANTTGKSGCVGTERIQVRSKRGRTVPFTKSPVLPSETVRTVEQMTAETVYRAPLQERSEETFERILRAARACFEERRSTTVGVRELCAASGVSRSSFYARFPNVESVVITSYDRFAARARAVVEDVDEQWARHRSGNSDFEAFVRFMVAEHLRFYDRERPLVQAFRAGEPNCDPLVSRRQALDAHLIRRAFEVTERYYPGFDGKRVLAAVAAEGALLIASARSVFDFSDQLLAPGASPLDDSRQLLDQFTEMVVAFVRRAHAPPPPHR